MPTSESDRLEMHLKLRAVLGDKVADTVMEHLPPAGWTDVARQSEMIARFEAMDSRFQAVDARFEALDAKFEALDAKFEALEVRFEALESRLNGIVAGLWALGSIFSASFVALFALVATRL